MHPSGLSDQLVAEILRLWQDRTTIDSLAERFDITPDQVRKIIAVPRKENN